MNHYRDSRVELTHFFLECNTFFICYKNVKIYMGHIIVKNILNRIIFPLTDQVLPLIT